MTTPAPPRRILVADDMPDLRLLLQITLERAGFEVAASARDGAEALRLWDALKAEGVDAVILDQRMPEKTGLDVARHILEEAPETRIIIFSGHIDAALEAEALEVGVYRCLDKDQLLKLHENIEWLFAEPQLTPLHVVNHVA